MSETVEYILRLRDSFSGPMQDAAKHTRAFEGSLNSAKSVAAGLRSTIVQAFSVYEVINFAKGIFEVGKQFENAEMGLTTLMKSAGAAKEVFNNIQEDAEKTPFDFKTLLMGNRALIGAGESAEAARKVILDLGNAISATGGGAVELERMVTNMQQIKNVGQATALDIKQFAYAGIPIYKMLEEAGIKYTKGQQVSYEQLAAALAHARATGGMFANGLENAMNTVEGRASNLGDQFAMFQKKIFDSIKTNIAGVISGLSQAMTFVSEHMDEAIRYVKGAFNAVADYLLPLWETVKNVFSQIWASIKQTTEFLSQYGAYFGEILTEIREGLGWIISFVGDIVTHILQGFQKLAVGALNLWSSLKQFSSQFGSLFAFVKEAVLWIVDHLADLYTWIISVTAAIVDVMHTIYVLLDKIGAVWLVVKIFEAVWWSIKKIGQGIAWLYNHTLAPIFDAIAWTYGKIKDLLGIKDYHVTATAVVKNIKESGPMDKVDESVAGAATGAAKAAAMSKGKVGSSAEKVTGNKSVTIHININNLVNTLSVKAANLNESMAMIQEKVSEALLKAVNDGQIIAST